MALRRPGCYPTAGHRLLTGGNSMKRRDQWLSWGLVVIILVNLLLLGLGMILDAISISYMIMPILIPVLTAFKIDPLWYGVIFISALAIGQATPPVGVNLFTAANLIKGDVDSVAKEAIPYVIVDVVVLVILSLLPILSLFLPIKAGLYAP